LHDRLARENEKGPGQVKVLTSASSSARVNGVERYEMRHAGIHSNLDRIVTRPAMPPISDIMLSCMKLAWPIAPSA
jgi:hypothetical protein